ELTIWTAVYGPAAAVASPGLPAVSWVPSHCCMVVGGTGSFTTFVPAPVPAPAFVATAASSLARFAAARPAEGGSPCVDRLSVALGCAGTARRGMGADVDRPRTTGVWPEVRPAVAGGANTPETTLMVVARTVDRIRDLRTMDHLSAVRRWPGVPASHRHASRR